MVEASLLDHLEALRRALWRIAAAVLLLLGPAFWSASHVLRFMIRTGTPPGTSLHYFAPLEPFMVELNIALALALAAALPVTIFELWNFVAPGMYRSERRFAGWVLGFGLLLPLGGAAAAWFWVLPLVMKFGGSFAGKELVPVIGIGDFMHLALMLMLGFSVMALLPVVLLLLVRSGMVGTATLRRARPYVLVAILVIAAVLTPPDVISQMMMGVPAYLLFEAALLIARVIEPKAKPEKEDRDGKRHTAQAEQIESADSPLPVEYRRASRRKRRIRPL